MLPGKAYQRTVTSPVMTSITPVRYSTRANQAYTPSFTRSPLKVPSQPKATSFGIKFVCLNFWPPQRSKTCTSITRTTSSPPKMSQTSFTPSPLGEKTLLAPLSSGSYAWIIRDRWTKHPVGVRMDTDSKVVSSKTKNWSGQLSHKLEFSGLEDQLISKEGSLIFHPSIKTS